MGYFKESKKSFLYNETFVLVLGIIAKRVDERIEKGSDKSGGRIPIVSGFLLGKNV